MIFLGDYSHQGKRFPPWSWSCDITWHDELVFLLLLIPHVLLIFFHHFSLQGVSYHCDYHFNWGSFNHFVQWQKYFILLLLSCLLAMTHPK